MGITLGKSGGFNSEATSVRPLSIVLLCGWAYFMLAVIGRAQFTLVMSISLCLIGCED